MAKLADRSKYRRRIVDDRVDRCLSKYGAVSIEGPRWCGKSWTASVHCADERLIESDEDNFYTRYLAETSPDILLRGDVPLLIDEWQDVPKLWDAVRYECDRRNRPGQFILTGSSFLSGTECDHTGICRIAELEMGTMTLYEMGDSTGEVSLKKLCDGELSPTFTGEVTVDRLARYVVRGGWPSTLHDDSDMPDVADAYIATIINKDASKSRGRGVSRSVLERLLYSLARCECSSASDSTVISDVFHDAHDSDAAARDENRKTVMNQMDFLADLHLLDYTPPYSFTRAHRSVDKARGNDKRHFCDVSLASSLLDATPETLVRDPETLGLMFESLCEHDLKIYAESFDAKTYYYRKNDRNEIDAVIRLADGRTCAFEIKLGASKIESASGTLIETCADIGRDGGTPPSVLCVICGTTNRAYRRDDGVFVVPITSLGP